jgi:hypothetical protein
MTKRSDQLYRGLFNGTLGTFAGYTPIAVENTTARALPAPWFFPIFTSPARVHDDPIMGLTSGARILWGRFS